jgi:hypothetical protein
MQNENIFGKKLKKIRVLVLRNTLEGSGVFLIHQNYEKSVKIKKR